MIEIKHLSKTFQMKDGAVNALKDISLTIPDGSIYGIIGMSGAATPRHSGQNWTGCSTISHWSTPSLC